jgi:hypothetical protein
MKMIILSLLICLTSAASAQQPTPETLDRFLKVYQFEPVREIFAFTLNRDTKAEISNWYATPEMTPQLRAAIDNYQIAVSVELQHQMSSVNLRHRYAAIFGTVFTEQEMQDIIRFYESPAGRASVAKRPQIAALIQEQMRAIAADMQVNLNDARLQIEKAARNAK